MIYNVYFKVSVLEALKIFLVRGYSITWWFE